MRLATWLIATALLCCASAAHAATFTPVSSLVHSHAFTNNPAHTDMTPPDIVNGPVYGSWVRAPSLTVAGPSGSLTGEMAIDLTLQAELIKFGGAGHGAFLAGLLNSGGDSHAEAVVDVAGATDFLVGIGKDQLTNFQMSLMIKNNGGATIYTRSATPGTTSFPDPPVLDYFPLTLSPGRYTFIADNLENGTGFGNALITITPIPEPAFLGVAALLVAGFARRRTGCANCYCKHSLPKAARII